LLVSHDRGLLESACEDFWWVHAGEVCPYAGDLASYERDLLVRAKNRGQPRDAAAASPSPVAGTVANPKLSRQRQAQARMALQAQTAPLKRECQQLEKQIQEWEAQRTSLHAAMAAPQTGPQWAQMGQELKGLEERIAEAEHRWLDLQEQLQALETP